MHSKGRHASGVARDGLGLRLASRRSDVTNRLGALVRQSTMEIGGSITPPNTSLCADRSGSGGRSAVTTRLYRSACLYIL